MSRYDMRTSHGNDGRSGAGRLRLCFSDIYSNDSVWRFNRAAENHWRIDQVPLIAVKDMRHLHHANDFHCKEGLSPVERITQQGKDACQSILTRLLCGRQSSVPNHKRRVVVVDLNPECGDWADASLALHRDWQDGQDMCGIVYVGIFKGDVDDKSDFQRSRCNGLKSHMSGTLMQTWWNQHPEAGPEEPPDNEIGSVQKPTLQLLSWGQGRSSNMPIVPEVVRDRFKDSEEYQPQWLKLCTNIEKSVLDMSALRPNRAGTRPSNQNQGQRSAIQLDGPDLHGETFVKPASVTVAATEVALSSIDMTQVLLCWKK